MSNPENKNPELTNPSNTLDQKLRAQQGDAVTDMNKLIDDQMDWSIQKFGDYGVSVTSELKGLYFKKAQELRVEAEKMEGKLNTQEILALQDSILLGLKQRLILMLEITGGAEIKDKVDNMEELDKLRTMGMSIISNTDAAGLVYDHLQKTKPEVAAQYLETLGRAIRPDTYELLRKSIDSKETLNEADYTLVISYLHKLNDPTLSEPEKAVAMALVAALRPDQRLGLIEALMKDPEMPQILETLLKSTYVTKDQVFTILDQHPDLKEKYPLLIETLNETTVSTFQAKVELAKKQAIPAISRRSFGHRNSARELLTFKGIGGLFLTINGAMTVGANLLMNIGGEENTIIDNPAILLGLAETGVGLEMSNGLGGVGPKPSKIWARLLLDKDKESDAQHEAAAAAFARSFGNHPMEARFYYTMREKITAAYKEQKVLQKTTRPVLTVNMLGISWEQLPSEYKTLSQHALEAQVSDWASGFAQDFGKAHPETQKLTMNEIRKGFGLPPYQTDETLEKWIQPQAPNQPTQ